MNINNSAWMQSPNVRMGILVMLAMLPTFVADLSVGKVTWITLCVALMGGLTTLKAFMSDPNQPPPSGTTGGGPALKVGAVILGFVLLFGISQDVMAGPFYRARPVVVVPVPPVIVVPVQPVVIVPAVQPRVVVIVDPTQPIYRFRPVYYSPGAKPFYYQLVPWWNP
jgi:hypothetical protein